jgi:uncharacterized protein (TIGR01777 family)
MTHLEYQKILIPGGSGFIGNKLAKAWKLQGKEIIILTRGKEKLSDGILYLSWDGKSIPTLPWIPEVMVNLSGAGIADHPWTEAYKKTIWDSRMLSSRACKEFIQAHSNQVKLWVNSSAVGYYGASTETSADENHLPGNDFQSKLAIAWEAETQGVSIPVSRIRTGIVLGIEGGALPRLLPVFRLGIGGPLGGGHQPFPWIHAEDVVSSIQFIVESSNPQGAWNLVAPEVINNAKFSTTLAKVLNRPCLFGAPGWALRLFMGDRASLVLEGQKVIPTRLLQEGFSFKYSSVKEALKDLVG